MLRTDLKRVARETIAGWSADKVPRLGAALAYYAALSIAPLLLIVIGVAGLALGNEAAQGQIVGQIRGLIGLDGAKAIEDVLAHSRQPAGGVTAAIVGTVTLLVGASGVFGQLQDALNTIWHVDAKPSGSWMTVLKDRFVSLTMVFGVGFLLLVSLVISAALAAAGAWLQSIGPGLEAFGHLIDFALSITVASALFAMIFKYLPDAPIRWSDVRVGAVATALLFVVGKTAIGLYLGHASVGSTYGAAGSFVVLLVWVYYSTQILLLGAEFTRAWAAQTDSRLGSVEDAVPSRPAARGAA